MFAWHSPFFFLFSFSIFSQRDVCAIFFSKYHFGEFFSFFFFFFWFFCNVVRKTNIWEQESELLFFYIFFLLLLFRFAVVVDIVDQCELLLIHSEMATCTSKNIIKSFNFSSIHIVWSSHINTYSKTCMYEINSERNFLFKFYENKERKKKKKQITHETAIFGWKNGQWQLRTQNIQPIQSHRKISHRALNV